MRTAQGLSVSTLIVITLGILVLITSILFFTDVWKKGTKTISDCQNLGGTCQEQPCGAGQNSFGDCGTGYCCAQPGQNT